MAFYYDVETVQPTLWAPPPPSNQPFLRASLPNESLALVLPGLPYTHHWCQLYGMIALTGYPTCYA